MHFTLAFLALDVRDGCFQIPHIGTFQEVGHTFSWNIDNASPREQITDSSLLCKVILVSLLRHDLAPKDKPPWLRPSLLEFSGVSVRALRILHKDQLDKDIRIGGIGTDASGELGPGSWWIGEMCICKHVVEDAACSILPILMHPVTEGSITIITIFHPQVSQLQCASVAVTGFLEHRALHAHQASTPHLLGKLLDLVPGESAQHALADAPIDPELCQLLRPLFQVPGTPIRLLRLHLARLVDRQIIEATCCADLLPGHIVHHAHRAPPCERLLLLDLKVHTARPRGRRLGTLRFLVASPLSGIIRRGFRLP